VTASGERVLVVEDDEGMREAIESLLGAAGFKTAGYASAEALLGAAALEGVRCIVSDVRLPAMSGLDLLGALRARGDAPPVILITAHDSAALCDEAGRRGAAAYLPKPFAASELLGAIARAAH
jgi:two-component system response regulator FixJ